LHFPNIPSLGGAWGGQFFRQMIKILFFILIAFTFGFTNAQDSLDDLLKTAAKNNPALKSKYNKYLASLQKVPQVGSLPDPDLSFGYFIEPMEVLGGKQRAQIQLMQMFPWQGTLNAAKNEAAQMAQSDFEAFRAEKEELFFNVRKSYFQLYLIDRQIAVNDSAQTLLHSMERLLLVKFGNETNTTGGSSPTRSIRDEPAPRQSGMGMGSGNDTPAAAMNGGSSMNTSGSALSALLQLRIETGTLENTIASLKQRRAILITQLNLLINRDVNTPVRLPKELPVPNFDYQSISLFDSIKQNNPMLKMSKADIEAYRYRQVMNRKMGYPMVGIGLNYTVVAKSEMSTSSMNGKDMIMPMLSVKLPIYRKKYRASVREAQLLEQSASDNAANVQNMLFMEFTDTQLSIDEANRNLRLTTRNIELTRQRFNLLRAQLSTSGSGLDELLRTHQSLLDYRISILQAETDKRIAYAGLQKLKASPDPSTGRGE
jgi:outer membrane protein TolC